MPGTCELCGEEARPVFGWAKVDPWGQKAHQDIHACQPCIDRQENQEPAEPDGESFRGGEAAAYDRERMAEAQSLK